MKPIDLRVRLETLELAQALVEQRGLERAVLLRDALDVGLQIIAASGPPAAGGEAETYGTFAGQRLAQWLRPRIAPVLDFLNRYGAAPVMASGISSAADSAPTPSTMHRMPSPVPVDAAVHGALDGFGVGALGEC